MNDEDWGLGLPDPSLFASAEDVGLDPKVPAEKCIERGCSKCGRTFMASIPFATEIEPDSRFSICGVCREAMRDAGGRIDDDGNLRKR